MALRRRTVLAVGLSALAMLGVAGLASADTTTFVGPAYPAAYPDCTPAARSSHGITPVQWQSVVGLPLTPSGTPARQRIVLGQRDQQADLAGVRELLRLCGLPAVTISQFGPDGGGNGEATLDASVAASALPANADLVLASVATSAGFAGLLEASAQACGIDTSQPVLRKKPATDANPYPPGGCIISVSYEKNEASYLLSDPGDVTATDQFLRSLEDLGVIVVFSAGDESSGGCSTDANVSGASVGLTPKYPATSPVVLAVGGTQWDSQTRSMAEGRSIGYHPGDGYANVVWKDSAYSSKCANSVVNGVPGGTGGGGGVSQHFALPVFQSTAVSATYPQQPGKRLVPDVSALAAWPMYAIYKDGDWSITGGTSAAAPSVAVGIANVNAALTAVGLSPLDNAGGALDIHTVLYGSAYASAISDVTVGDNDLFSFDGSTVMPGYPTGAPAWQAEPGYDMASGLGVINFGTLAQLLISHFTPTPPPSPSPTPTATPSATATATPSVTATPSASPTPTPPNPSVAATPAPGIVVLSADRAADVPPRLLLRDPAGRPGAAPRVPASTRTPIALVVSGLVPARLYRVSLGDGDTRAPLGATTADADGLARLPVFQVSDAGRYTVILRDARTGTLRYVRLVVDSP